MHLVADIARRTRPLRRRITPREFKETYINEALARVPDAVYLEIGVRDGESMRIVRAERKIGVDPLRSAEMRTLRPGEEFYEKTSDAFFAEDAGSVLGDARIAVALVDGLHEFSQALRDVLNLEPYMREDGIIVVDDCNPPSRERAVDTPTGGVWNGDVWKIAAYLKDERPDLTYFTIDADQGIGIVSGFSGPQVAALPPGETVQRYKQLDYSYLDRNRTDVLGLVQKAPLSRLVATPTG